MRVSGLVSVIPVCLASLAAAQEGEPVASRLAPVGDDGRVDVRQFSESVVDGDWSRAIQAAVDSVSEANGFTGGATVFLPPGTYRIDQPITLGGDRGQWGLHLLGHGATLVGTEKLDQHPWADGEPEETKLGVPILVVRGVEGFEGSGFCIEGLQLSREARATGVGISFPKSDRVPKGTSLRNVRVFGQNVGIHINLCWQIYFSDCIFRGNDIGMIIQNHGNNIGLVNCIFRRNHHHGLVIGPDRGQTASNGQHISNCIFESNKGYGMLLLSSAQTVIAGNYFEANGNDIGVMTPWQTTIDTNLFWSSYGHGWRRNEFSDNAHIVVKGARRLRIRNNHYAAVNAWFRRKEDGGRWEYVPVPPGPVGTRERALPTPEKETGFEYEERPVSILIAGHFAGDHVFDALPAVHHEARIEATRIARDTGLDYYEYDPETNLFVMRSLLGDR